MLNDNEGGTIQISGPSNTYVYEIDAFNEETLRIHTAVKNPNGGYQFISWNGKTGQLITNSFAGNLSGTADYAVSDNFGVPLHLHMKSGGILSKIDLNDAYGAARWYWIHEPTANSYEFAYGSMLTFGDDPYNQLVLAYHTDTTAPTLRWRTKVNNIWQPWSVALDNHNFASYVTPAAIGAPKISNNIILVSNLGGIGTDAYAGKYWQAWAYGTEADGYPVAWTPSSDGTQLLGTPERRIKTAYAILFVGNLSGTATYADSLTNLNAKTYIGIWGTLTAANGYTHVYNASDNTDGGITIAAKGGQLSLQIDGKFYQNEGKNVVIDSSSFKFTASTATLAITI